MNNQVMRNILERRSCRSFDTEKKVSENDVTAVLKAGAYAPSAMNTQSWHFTAVVNSEKLTLLNDAMLEYMDPAARERAASRAGGKRVSPFYNAPVLIIVSLEKGVSPYPEADCACALQNMFLAATSLGLGSCWINQLRGADGESGKAGALLTQWGMPQNHAVYGCCALGYADKESPLKDRSGGVVTIVR